MDVGRALMLIYLWLAVAGYVLVALELFARAVHAFANGWGSGGQIAGGRADVNLKSGAQGVINPRRKVRSWLPARRDARPTRELAGVLAQAAEGRGEEARAA